MDSGKCFNWHSQMELAGTQMAITVFTTHANINSMRLGLCLPWVPILQRLAPRRKLNTHEMNEIVSQQNSWNSLKISVVTEPCPIMYCLKERAIVKTWEPSNQCYLL